MANPFVKGWRYLMALFGAKIDEYADPKVQIQQAIEDAQRQHQALVQQAAAVIGNQRQLEMKLSRQMSEVEKLQGMARQALVLADRARAGGDEAEAAEVRADRHDARHPAGLRRAVDGGPQDPARPGAVGGRAGPQGGREQRDGAPAALAERTKLLSQLEQAKMQETVAKSLESMSSLAAPGNTPSLDEVRDKIEQRYANAMGRAELASNSVEGRMLEVQKSTLDMAGTSRLEQIRASMAGEQLGSGQAQPAVEQGARPPAADPASVARLDEIRASMNQKRGDTTRPADRFRVRGGTTMDERTRYFRRLKRLRGSARRWSVVGGGLSAAAVVLTPYAGIGLADAVWAAGAGASVVLACWRQRDHRELAAIPPPPAPPPALPGAKLMSAVERFPAGRTVIQEMRRQQGPATRCAARRSPGPGTGWTGRRRRCRASAAGSPGRARKPCSRRRPPSTGCVTSASGWPAWRRPSRSARPISGRRWRPSHESLADQFTEGVDGVRAAGRGRGELGRRGRSADRGRAAPELLPADRGDRPAARVADGLSELRKYGTPAPTAVAPGRLITPASRAGSAGTSR